MDDAKRKRRVSRREELDTVSRSSFSSPSFSELDWLVNGSLLLSLQSTHLPLPIRPYSVLFCLLCSLFSRFLSPPSAQFGTRSSSMYKHSNHHVAAAAAPPRDRSPQTASTDCEPQHTTSQGDASCSEDISIIISATAGTKTPINTFNYYYRGLILATLISIWRSQSVPLFLQGMSWLAITISIAAASIVLCFSASYMSGMASLYSRSKSRTQERLKTQT